MPAVRSESPALNRRSRTPAAKVGATIATTGVVTVASGALDPYQNGDLAQVVEAVDGVAITGGTTGTTPLKRNALYAIQKLSATTCALYEGSLAGTLVSNLGVALSAGGALQFGDPELPLATGNVRNILPAGSVAGGAFGGPLD
jgi:hypothetical protein